MSWKWYIINIMGMCQIGGPQKQDGALLSTNMEPSVRFHVGGWEPTLKRRKPTIWVSHTFGDPQTAGLLLASPLKAAEMRGTLQQKDAHPWQRHAVGQKPLVAEMATA